MIWPTRKLLCFQNADIDGAASQSSHPELEHNKNESSRQPIASFNIFNINPMPILTHSKTRNEVFTEILGILETQGMYYNVQKEF